VKNLKALGKSLEFITLKNGGTKMIQSVPCELSLDHTSVINSARFTGYTSVPELQGEFGWPTERARAAIDLLVAEGMAWIDNQNEGEDPLIWFPSFFPPQIA